VDERFFWTPPQSFLGEVGGSSESCCDSSLAFPIPGQGSLLGAESLLGSLPLPWRLRYPLRLLGRLWDQGLRELFANSGPIFDPSQLPVLPSLEPSLPPVAALPSEELLLIYSPLAMLLLLFWQGQLTLRCGLALQRGLLTLRAVWPQPTAQQASRRSNSSASSAGLQLRQL
jgi:hypothetical protein